MHLNFEKLKIGRHTAMKLAGYSYRKYQKDWLRWNGKAARFHAKIAGRNGINLHYDMYTGKDAHHFAFPLPMTEKDEIRRIVGEVKEMRRFHMK